MLLERMCFAWPAVMGRIRTFGLLGPNVTVLDLSDVQLERNRQAAIHHGPQESNLCVLKYGI
jgi:hypothetical protein